MGFFWKKKRQGGGPGGRKDGASLPHEPDSNARPYSHTGPGLDIDPFDDECYSALENGPLNTNLGKRRPSESSRDLVTTGDGGRHRRQSVGGGGRRQGGAIDSPPNTLLLKENGEEDDDMTYSDSEEEEAHASGAADISAGGGHKRKMRDLKRKLEQHGRSESGIVRDSAKEAVQNSLFTRTAPLSPVESLLSFGPDSGDDEESSEGIAEELGIHGGLRRGGRPVSPGDGAGKDEWDVDRFLSPSNLAPEKRGAAAQRRAGRNRTLIEIPKEALVSRASYLKWGEHIMKQKGVEYDDSDGKYYIVDEEGCGRLLKSDQNKLDVKSEFLTKDDEQYLNDMVSSFRLSSSDDEEVMTTANQVQGGTTKKNPTINRGEDTYRWDSEEKDQFENPRKFHVDNIPNLEDEYEHSLSSDMGGEGQDLFDDDATFERQRGGRKRGAGGTASVTSSRASSKYSKSSKHSRHNGGNSRSRSGRGGHRQGSSPSKSVSSKSKSRAATTKSSASIGSRSRASRGPIEKQNILRRLSRSVGSIISTSTKSDIRSQYKRNRRDDYDDDDTSLSSSQGSRSSEDSNSSLTSSSYTDSSDSYLSGVGGGRKMRNGTRGQRGHARNSIRLRRKKRSHRKSQRDPRNERRQRTSGRHGQHLLRAAHLEEEDEELVYLLKEAIPLYGRGDPATDRAVLDAIERIDYRRAGNTLNVPLDRRGNTAIMLACQYGADDPTTGRPGAAGKLVEALLVRGADPNVKDGDGAGCLHFVCYPDSFSPATASLLLEYGARVDAKERGYGCTPLHWAASSGDVGLCKMLCGAGALPNVLDSNGCDPLSYAKGSDCAAYLSFVRGKLMGGNYSRGPPISNGFAGAEITCKTVPPWIMEMDEDSGISYFYNPETNESLWEDAYKERMSSQDKTVEKQPDEAADEKQDKNSIPNKKSDLDTSNQSRKPPTRAPSRSGIAKVPSSSSMQTTFEDRLQSMQKKMEEQLKDQLKVLEEKIIISSPVSKTGKKMISMDELESKLAVLQTEINKKDVDILMLKREIADLNAELATAEAESEKKVTEEKEKADSKNSDDAWILSGKAKEMKEELKVKEGTLCSLQTQNLELVTKLESTKRSLTTLETKCQRAEEALVSAEETLQRERSDKDQVMALLNDTKQGIEVNGEVKKSLEDARKKDAEMIKKLRDDIRNVKTMTSAEIAALSELLETKERVLMNERNNAKDIVTELESKYKNSSEEKQILIKSREDELKDIRKHLKEERLAKMEKEVARNEAMQRMEEANERAKVAEQHYDEMKEMVSSAKELHEHNEKLHRQLQIETTKRRALHNKIEDMKGRIRVYVRIRPSNKKEIAMGSSEALKKEDKHSCALVPKNGKLSDAKTWEFDQIFSGMGEDNSQKAVFNDTKLLITSVVDGFNVCIFCYGQTGSGKTFTMFGSEIRNYDLAGDVPEMTGIAPRAAFELFKVLREKEAAFDITVTVSMFELYNDQIKDLLIKKKDKENPPKLKIHLAEHTQTGLAEVQGSVETIAGDVGDVLKIFSYGIKNRTTASTSMNEDSSRSHSITSIVVTLVNKRSGTVSRSKLTLVDLAGSERVGKSEVTGAQLKEAQSINKSLSALGDVIGSLTSGTNSGPPRHIPYRNSPLTMLMSDSLGGNAKTLLFCCVSPAEFNASESANSLDFSRRCKKVTNDINPRGGGGGGEAAKLKALREELAKIKKEKGINSVKKRSAARRPGE